MHPALRNASREERYRPNSKKPVIASEGEVSSRTILFRNNNHMVFVDRGDMRGDMVGVTEVFYGSRLQDAESYDVRIIDEADSSVERVRTAIETLIAEDENNQHLHARALLEWRRGRHHDQMVDAYGYFLRGVYSQSITDQARSRAKRKVVSSRLAEIWSQIYENLHAWAEGKKFGEEKPKRFPIHLKDLRVRTHWLLPSMPKPVIDCYEESCEPNDPNKITFLDLELIPNSLVGWKYSAENPYVHKREKSCN